MIIKEYFKERLSKIISEGRMYVGKGRWAAVEPRTDIQGVRVSALLASDPTQNLRPDQRQGLPPQKRQLGDLGNITTQTNQDFSKIKYDLEQAANIADKTAKLEGMRNLLNVVHHYSRNFNIQLDPKHIEGIDFSTGTFDDHVDQVSQRLRSPLRSR